MQERAMHKGSWRPSPSGSAIDLDNANIKIDDLNKKIAHQDSVISELHESDGKLALAFEI